MVDFDEPNGIFLIVNMFYCSFISARTIVYGRNGQEENG